MKQGYKNHLLSFGSGLSASFAIVAGVVCAGSLAYMANSISPVTWEAMRETAIRSGTFSGVFAVSTFGLYKLTDHFKWKSFASGAGAYIITAALSTGHTYNDVQNDTIQPRYDQSHTITIHMKK